MKRKLSIISLSLVALAAFWFLGVDGSWFVESCPDCLYGRHIFQVRVFTIPVLSRDQVYHSILEKITDDLGIPCSHHNLVRWHKHRYWGLLICACPCINGMYGLSGGDDWYDDKARAIVIEMAKTDPSLRDKFAERVLKNHDWNYLKTFVQKAQGLRDEKSP